MVDLVLAALACHLPAFEVTSEVVNCHHNYVEREHHFGANVWVTRKGAIRAREGDLGIIPGSMGARSYIVRGKGNPESFCSSAHGAGRREQVGLRAGFGLRGLEIGLGLRRGDLRCVEEFPSAAFGFRVGRRWRVRPEDLDRWLAERVDNDRRDETPGEGQRLGHGLAVPRHAPRATVGRRPRRRRHDDGDRRRGRRRSGSRFSHC